MLTDLPEVALRARPRGRSSSLGVTPLLGPTVVGIDEEAVTVEAPDGGSERIPARTKIWAAGVTPPDSRRASPSSGRRASTAPGG